MHRRQCKVCRRWSLATAGKWRCDCGSTDDTQDCFEAVKRVGLCQGYRTKFLPPAPVRAQILSEQQNRCLYCFCEFGSYRIKVGSSVAFQLSVQWDHVIPWEYARTHMVDFVAACQTCNRIKSDKVFASMDDARVYVSMHRERKYVDVVGRSWARARAAAVPRIKAKARPDPKPPASGAASRLRKELDHIREQLAAENARRAALALVSR